MAIGYAIFLRVFPGPAFDGRSFPSGGEGMAGTAGDYAKFLQAIRLGGEGVMRLATVESVQSHQIGLLQTWLGPGWGFGLGAAVVNDSVAASKPLSAGIGSWSGTYGTSSPIYRSTGTTLVAFTTTAPEGDKDTRECGLIVQSGHLNSAQSGHLNLAAISLLRIMYVMLTILFNLLRKVRRRVQPLRRIGLVRLSALATRPGLSVHFHLIKMQVIPILQLQAHKPGHCTF